MCPPPATTILAVGVGFRDELVSRQVVERRVGVEPGPVGKGELLGFDKKVQMLSRVMPQRLEVIRFKQIENLQSGNPLSVGR